MILSCWLCSFPKFLLTSDCQADINKPNRNFHKTLRKDRDNASLPRTWWSKETFNHGEIRSVGSFLIQFWLQRSVKKRNLENPAHFLLLMMKELVSVPDPAGTPLWHPHSRCCSNQRRTPRIHHRLHPLGSGRNLGCYLWRKKVKSAIFSRAALPCGP